MLPPGILCSRSPISPTRIRKLPYLIGAKLIIRVSLLQQRDTLQPPLASAQSCIR